MSPTGALNACPSTAELELLACGQPATPGLTMHVDSCPTCAARLASARDDASFLQRVRALAADQLGPEGAPRIPGYRALGVVSSGSQGVVYRATQESTSRTVAIKALAAGVGATPRQRLRAEREAEIAASLRHPNIVTVFESRTLPDGRIAVVMEFVDGVPLDAWEPPGGDPAERRRATLRAFSSVCSAIHHAHLNGVIHRDLKPDNILVTPEGRPVVLDFGIATAGGIRTTMTGEFAGTPAYASPEQVSRRPDDVDALTDVYSLGVILYRLLCGAMPYSVDGSIVEVARAIESSEPIPMRRLDPSIPKDLEAVVLRAIRKDKHRRYQSAAGLARDLERFLTGAPVEARSGSGWYVLRKAVAMNRRTLALAGTALIIAGAAAAAVWVSLDRAARHDREAREERIRARAVSELLREVLPNNDPDRPEVAAIAGAGLGRLFYRLETGAFSDEPELDQAIRRLWATVYTSLGSGKAATLVEYAEVSLRNGLVHLRSQHGNEHADIAATMHELAGVLLVRQRLPEAESMCRDALAMRQRLLGVAAPESAETRALLARILLAAGRQSDAAEHAVAVLSYYADHPGIVGDPVIAAMNTLLARVHLDSGDTAVCERHIRDALSRCFRRHAPEDPELLSALSIAADLAHAAPASTLAGLIASAWDTDAPSAPESVRQDMLLLASPDRGTWMDVVPTGRTAALTHLLRFQESLLGPDDPSLVRMLIAILRSAEGEGLFDVKTDAALRAADVLEHRRGKDDPTIIVLLEEASLVLALNGQAGRAADLTARACSLREAAPEATRDRLMDANSRRYLAWFYTLSGRHDEAISQWLTAVQMLRAALNTDRHHLIATAESGLAYSLSEVGRLSEADDLSARSLDMAESLPSTAQDQLAHIRFARGHVLRKLGRNEEALAMLQPIAEPYFRFTPPQWAWRRQYYSDLTEICSALGDSAAAANWRAWADDARWPVSPPNRVNTHVPPAGRETPSSHQ